MELTVTFRHSEPSTVLQAHIEERIGRLNKYFIKATKAHVILKVEGSRHVAEITLAENHHTFYAHEKSQDMYRSLDRALSKLERQLKTHKEKIKKHRPA